MADDRAKRIHVSSESAEVIVAMCRACRIAGLASLGVSLGGITGAFAGEIASSYQELDTTAAGALTFLGLLIGALLGCFVGLHSALGGWRESDPSQYDLWLDADGRDRKQVSHVVGALLGLDTMRARKLIDSDAPLLRSVRRTKADYLHARFSDFGLKIRVEPVSRSHA